MVGAAPRDWTDHGQEVAGAEEIWVAMLGRGIPAHGVVQQGPPVTQAQMAATIAGLVGADWKGFNAQAVPPVDFRLYLPPATTLERR